MIGQQIAADLESADRLVAAGGNEDPDITPEVITLETELPSRVSGTSYEIEIDDERNAIDLTTTDPAVEVSVSFATDTGIEDDDSLSGGSIEITYEADGLAVRSA